MNTAARPLDKMVVVEFSTSVAGPFVGQVLGDLGAEVYKVERPVVGDDARLWGPPFVDGVAPVFTTLNRNKHSLAVDLKDPAQRAALKAFILDRADVVVQNLRPGLIAEFGLDAGVLREERPDLIYCNLTAYGSTGPRRMQPGYDPLMQAAGGIMSVTGLEGHEPVRVGPSLVDQGAGMWAVIGIMSALVERQKTGVGTTVDTSLYETAVGWLPAQIANYLASGKAPKRIGSENAGIAPYKAFEASDGWLVIAAGNNGLFTQLTRVLDREGWTEDPRFDTNPHRVENRGTLNTLIQEVIATRSRSDWLEALDKAGVPAAPVLSIDETVTDAQFEALGLLSPVPGSEQSLIALPLSYDGVRPDIRAGAPAVGDRTDLLSAYMQKEEEDVRHS